jgi:hypothetical protein
MTKNWLKRMALSHGAMKTHTENPRQSMFSPEMTCGFKVALACGVVLPWSTAGADDATSGQAQNWSGSFVARVEALALLETLNAELLNNNSATLTLEHWCDIHHLASPPRIVAVRVSDVDKPASPEQRRELDVTLLEHRALLTLPDGTPFSEVVDSYAAADREEGLARALSSNDVTVLF